MVPSPAPNSIMVCLTLGFTGVAIARDKAAELGLTEPTVFKLLIASLRKVEELITTDCSAKHSNFSDSSNQLKGERNVKQASLGFKLFSIKRVVDGILQHLIPNAGAFDFVILRRAFPNHFAILFTFKFCHEMIAPAFLLGFYCFDDEAIFFCGGKRHRVVLKDERII